MKKPMGEATVRPASACLRCGDSSCGLHYAAAEMRSLYAAALGSVIFFFFLFFLPYYYFFPSSLPHASSSVRPLSKARSARQTATSRRDGSTLTGPLRSTVSAGGGGEELPLCRVPPPPVYASGPRGVLRGIAGNVEAVIHCTGLSTK